MKSLETFLNPAQENDYCIKISIPEFTCLCPKTNQPDFATLQLVYVPEKLCVELKSLKLYIHSFRNEGAFHEDVTNKILSTLVQSISPRFMQLTSHFYPRGGIHTSIVVEHKSADWNHELETSKLIALNVTKPCSEQSVGFRY